MSKVKCQMSRGFTLIEMLVFLFIFALITVTFYSAWSAGTRHILLVKNRLIASALANEKMEVVRNMAFDDVALTTSAPAGNIVQDEDMVRSGRSFHVFTQIRKVDDPFDGTLGGSPNDPNFVDYKYVKITISWDGDAQSLSTSSRFVPAGIEQPAAGQGVLVVNVTSDKAGGALVSGSEVRVKNTEEGFDEKHDTDNFGRLMLVGVPESIKKYEITITKTGYETVLTFAPYPDGPYDPPVHEHASVIAGALNTINMYQNELSDFSVKTIDYLEGNAADINYYLKGGKQLGADPNPPNGDVYTTDSHDQTNSSGEKNYGAISPGNSYEFTLEEIGYKIIGINPVAPFSLAPGETKTLTVKVGSENATSLLVKVTDGADGPPVSGASVQLTNGSGYNKTIVTESDGMAFFPDVSSPPFAADTYNLSITAAGYQNYTGQVTVNANELKEETVPLTAS